MDMTWIRKGVRRLSFEHLKGFEEFMQFFCQSVANDSHVLCPCWLCLNHETELLGKVDDHLILYGMASTYDRWIHHGEPLRAEHGPEAHHAEHGPETHHAEHVEDVPEADGGLEEEDEFEDD
jgi:hypothetical protein